MYCIFTALAVCTAFFTEFQHVLKRDSFLFPKGLKVRFYRQKPNDRRKEILLQQWFLRIALSKDVTDSPLYELILYT